ncbi:MAG: SpoIID/LytB domain-containing protein [Clostridia bacterium]|nr:SpoIID/LytB domain-containing protein [Clostridia bacterium]
MRSFDLKSRLISAVLAIVFCAGAVMLPAENAKSVSAKENGSQYVEPNVRVGLYTKTSLINTRRFSSLNVSQNGFDIGYATNASREFNKLFSISNTSVVILPQVNASIDLSSSDKDCSAGNGSIGAYSVIVGKHSSYDAAKASAKSVGGFVAVVSGGYEVRVNPSQSYDAAKAASNGRPVASPASGGITVVDSSTGKILFTFEDASRPFALRDKNGGTVKIPVTRNSKTSRYAYFGFFTYSVSDNKLSMVNTLPLETYVKCVITNEIGYSASDETVKVFSVLVRTFPQNRKHGSLGFDVCQTTCCQAYYGSYRFDERNNKLVDATRGLICTINGKPTRTVYHVSSGNATCSSVAAWGGNVSYLTSVQLEEKKPYVWDHEYTKEEFYKFIKSRDAFSKLKDSDLTMKITATDPHGSDYITRLVVTDGKGNSVEIKSSEKVRMACGYQSANFKIGYVSEMKVLTSDGTVETKQVSGVMTENGYEAIEGFGDTDYKLPSGASLSADKLIVNGQGRGHGVGISKQGSETLASQGYNFKYILSFFYKGTELGYATQK